MTTQPKSRQRGISFLGLIFVATVLAIAGVLAVQVVPTVLEYISVQRAVQKAAEGQSVGEVRSFFTKAASVNNVKSITGEDIEIAKVGDRVVVSFSYEREIHLVGPAYLTLKYAGQSK